MKMLGRVKDYIDFNKFLKSRVSRYDALYEEYKRWRNVVEMIALHIPANGRFIFKKELEIGGYKILGLKLRGNSFSLDPWDIAFVTKSENGYEFTPIPFSQKFAESIYKFVLQDIDEK